MFVLTLIKRRIPAWRWNPVQNSNMMVDNKERIAITSAVTVIERKTPIREFLLMQNNILSTIFCRSPISLMEPWEPEEFLERRLDPLRSGLYNEYGQS